MALQEHGRHALNKPGGDAGLLSPILAEYAGQPAARRVDILFSGPADRTDFLRDGRADVGLLYAPFDDLDGCPTWKVRRCRAGKGYRAGTAPGPRSPTWFSCCT
jgi:hypothetical protein